MIIIIFLLMFLPQIVSAQYEIEESTITPTQEEIDWNNIYKLDSNKLEALELAKKDDEYEYLIDKIDTKRAVIELNTERKERNQKLGRGYYGHINQNQIEKRKKTLEKVDSKEKK